MGITGAGVEGGGSSEELEIDVMLLKEGKEMFLGIIAVEAFVIFNVGIVLFEDSTLIFVAFAGVGISGTVVFSRDVSLIC